jgi:hypothetical protein
MIKRSIFRFFLLIFLCSLTFADESLETKNIKNSRNIYVYLHPFSDLSFINPFFFIANVSTSTITLPFYLTVEFQFNEYISLIINPSVLLSTEPHNSKNGYLRTGSGIGIRHFTTGQSYGIYVQLIPSAYYMNIIRQHYVGHNDDGSIIYKEDISSLIIDALCYIGYSSKSSRTFFDVGFGYTWSSFVRKPSEVLALGSVGRRGASLDINLGIGFNL